MNEPSPGLSPGPDSTSSPLRRSSPFSEGSPLTGSCHLTFIHRAATSGQLRNLVLASSLARRHGFLVHLHTTPELSVELHDRGLRATYWTRTFVEHRPWSRHKIDTYQSVCSGYSGAFLHIDDDFFMLEAPPFDLTEQRLTVQCAESPDHYTWATRLPESWTSEFGSTKAYNMGLFAGPGDWVETYAVRAYRAMKAAPHPLPPNVEQLILGRCVQDHGWSVETLAGLDHRNPPKWYWHLMAEKRKPETAQRVWKLLQEFAPDVDLPAPDSVTPVRIPFRVAAGKITASTVRDWSRTQKPAVRQQWQVQDPRRICLTNSARGVGDTVVLTDLERAAHAEGKSAYVTSSSLHWSAITRYCPEHRDKWLPLRVCLPGAHRQWGLGPGHLIQRARRLFGLKPTVNPAGLLVVPGVRPIKGRVVLHTTPGTEVGWQRENVHPRARLLYPDTKTAVLWLASRRKDLTFIEVGLKRTLNHPRIEDGTEPSLENLIRLTAEGEWFIGINSGPMHVAAALGVKTVAIINFPRPILLPGLLDTGTVDEEWLYPQGVHLHQGINDCPWMPPPSARNLEKALAGEVYPYWSDEVQRELINEV